MAKIDLKINAEDGYGKKNTTTIAYVNPEATNEILIQFAQKINNLTSNRYTSTEKVTTTTLDTEE